MPSLGPWELIVILLIVVVIFGAGRLSEVGGAVGKSIREFRRATTDDSSTHATAVAPPVAPAAPLTSPTVAPSVAIENKCPSCATVNPTGQVFCGQCGTRLTRAA
jgi:sec-independent protein translocase protein TatA